MRLIKATVKNTFPNFTDVALQSTQTEIDAAVSATANGVAALADAGAFFHTNNTDGFTNPASGEIDLKLAGTLAAQFVNSSSKLTLTWNGALNTTGPITGPGIIPIGGMIMWLDDNLPATGGVWCWANGGVLSRTTAGAGLELYTEWSRNGANPLRYGAGDGSTTFNVINMQEVVPVGKSTMGSAVSPGLLASISATLKGVLGGLFGADTHTLTTAEIPSITSAGANTINVSGTNSAAYVQTGGGQLGSNGTLFTFGQQTSAPISASGSNNIGVTSTNTGGGAHTIVQPSCVVNFIIRIA
ncbi:hypothetical protein [Bradyrhizobium sp. dw_78]|uniref:hypothetical protein n=1 Tax=Bradyrhizobium sp. dw_78 TaxID=2719793 RepID=UPI001BD667E1|nr:hypothetical protein [Bradyrhizobium sp. dw_78]